MTTPHMPKQPQKPPEALRVINSRGDVLGSAPHFSQRNSAYKLDPALMSWDRVYINHYAVKSRDLVELKQRRGDANGRRAKHRQPGHPQFEAWNRNTVQDASILATRAARTAKINEMLAQPEILAGHLQGLRWFLDKKQPGA